MIKVVKEAICKELKRGACLAQLVEHTTLDLGVVSSSTTLDLKKYKLSKYIYLKKKRTKEKHENNISPESINKEIGTI